MKTLIIAMIAITSACNIFASSTLFGEIDTKFLVKNNGTGDYASITGLGTTFGFQGEQALNNSDAVYFSIRYQSDAMADPIFPVQVARSAATPYTTAGAAGFRGRYGQIELFYNESPLGALNDRYYVMANTPDYIYEIVGGFVANSHAIPAGDARMDGMRYTSGDHVSGLSFDLAVVPEEAVDGQTGFSFAAHLNRSLFRLSAALELDAEYNNTELLRLNGEVDIHNTTVGTTYQSGFNKTFGTEYRHRAVYLKATGPFFSHPTRAKLLLAHNAAYSPTGTETAEMYSSYVQEFPLTPTASAYAFASMGLRNNLADKVRASGGGLVVKF